MIIIAKRREAEEQIALRMDERHDMSVSKGKERGQEDFGDQQRAPNTKATHLSPPRLSSSNVNSSSTIQRINSFICSS